MDLSLFFISSIRNPETSLCEVSFDVIYLIDEPKYQQDWYFKEMSCNPACSSHKPRLTGSLGYGMPGSIPPLPGALLIVDVGPNPIGNKKRFPTIPKDSSILCPKWGPDPGFWGG
jgi:hypothetical protein